MFYNWKENDTLEKVSEKLKIAKAKILNKNKDVDFLIIKKDTIIRVK